MALTQGHFNSRRSQDQIHVILKSKADLEGFSVAGKDSIKFNKKAFNDVHKL
jgi:hypothetical protein